MSEAGGTRGPADGRRRHDGGAAGERRPRHVLCHLELGAAAAGPALPDDVRLCVAHPKGVGRYGPSIQVARDALENVHGRIVQRRTCTSADFELSRSLISPQ